MKHTEYSAKTNKWLNEVARLIDKGEDEDRMNSYKEGPYGYSSAACGAAEAIYKFVFKKSPK